MEVISIYTYIHCLFDTGKDFLLQPVNPLLTIFGLLLDMFGAFFVASEVVKPYKLEKYTSPIETMAQMTDISPFPAAREDIFYRQYELIRYRNMKIGITLLTIGFIMQIIPNAIQLFAK